MLFMTLNPFLHRNHFTGTIFSVLFADIIYLFQKCVNTFPGLRHKSIAYFIFLLYNDDSIFYKNQNNLRSVIIVCFILKQ